MADFPSYDQRPRENWGTKLGVILAVSGSAVGLGNFLRFPGQAAANGGGAFMIPYFISLLILGIPICWAEWTLGRQGGRLGFNSAPGVFHALTRNPVLRLFGALAILIPVVIYMYYVYIEAWCLGYAYDYLVGNMSSLGHQVDAYKAHFAEFVGADADGLMRPDGGVSPVVYCLVIVFVINFVLIYRGVNKGIETFCKYAMPMLIVSALIVLVRVLTLPPQPVPEPWQFSLQQGMPAASWRDVHDVIRQVNETALAVLADPSEEVTDRDRETARTAPAKAVVDAVGLYYKAVTDGDDAYRAGVAVAAPHGYLATPAGIQYALDQLTDETVAEIHREWVRATREALTREQKWDLLHYEAREAELSAVLDNPDAEPADLVDAETELSTRRAQRREVLATVGLPPALGTASDADAYLRGAAAEVTVLDRSVTNGLGFMWNPFTASGGRSIWAALADPKVWLAASSQIFFSLSVGFGIIITYSTYLRRNDDVALNGLTAAATNEFCEVCLGGLITIPAAFIFLGLGAVQGAGTFDLGFYTTPAVFAQMPAGRFFGFVWFFMLLLAAITSSLSMLQPAIAFLEEGFKLSRRASVALLGLLTANGTLVVMYFSGGLTGLDTMDFWIGNLCIFVMATVLVIVFGWVLGAEKGFKLAAEGADLKIPRFFTFVIKYVSPVYLLVIFGFWLYVNAGDYAKSVISNNAATFTVVFILLVMVFFTILVRLANKRWDAEGRGTQEMNP